LIDLLRQSFNDSGFTYACFSDEERIILVFPQKGIDHLINLILSADDRIDEPVSDFFGQIRTEIFDRHLLLFFFIAFRIVDDRRVFLVSDFAIDRIEEHIEIV